MAPQRHATDQESNQSRRRPRFVVRGLLAVMFALVAVLPGGGWAPVRAQDANEPSLTLTSFECAGEVALDGAPILDSDCEAAPDRAFTLTGPDDQIIELTTGPEPESDEDEPPTAVWSADPDDELLESGSWTLREVAADDESAYLVSCLKITGLKATPARLEYGDDRGVEFEWDAAVALSPDTVAGEYLNCGWYSVPPLSTDERPGLLTIRSTTVPDPEEVELVVVDPEGTAEDFGDTEAAAPPPSSFTLINDQTGARQRLDETDAFGPLTTTTFALSAGAYTLLVNATGQRASFTLEEGQTVLAINRLEGSAVDAADPTAIVVDPEDGADPTAIVIDLAPADPAPTVPAPTAEPLVRTPPQSFEFSATDWSGAYPDLVTAVYGRDCVALYGVNSDYPSATLTFDADEATGGESELVLTGLDDEFSGQNPIVVTVNGEVVYQGASGFNSWNGSSSQVAFSQVQLEFDSDLIVDGENEITVTNLSQAANFGTPPYILLAEAELQISAD